MRSIMVWLTLIVGIQVLGFGITLACLIHDEWRQRCAARKNPGGDQGLSDLKEVRAMENDSVIALDCEAGKRMRRLWRFRYPHEVVCDPDLDWHEKRAILAAWASDEHAVESMPTLRHLPGTPAPVTFSAIMDARAQLDRLGDAANDDDPPPPPVMRKRLGVSRAWRAAA
jgi:hypothetical protein